MNKLGCLLRRASNVVPTVRFEYRIFSGENTNSIGNSIASYGEWIWTSGHVQPGLTFSFNARGISNPGMIMKQLGLDQSKDIMTVFVRGLNLHNVHEQNQPDQIRYHGRIYNIWSISNWYEYDDWKSIICIEDTRERQEEEEEEEEESGGEP